MVTFFRLFMGSDADGTGGDSGIGFRSSSIAMNDHWTVKNRLGGINPLRQANQRKSLSS